MADGRIDIGFTLGRPALWDVDSPNLYLARVSLLDAAGVEIDDLVRTFGVRTIALEGTRFVLNGRTIVPRGTHDLSTYFGESLICPGDRAIVTDILLHKGMNATCSRWPSDMRMHYPRIAEAADQLGFMLSWTDSEMWDINPEAEVYARAMCAPWCAACEATPASSSGRWGRAADARAPRPGAGAGTSWSWTSWRRRTARARSFPRGRGERARGPGRAPPPGGPPCRGAPPRGARRLPAVFTRRGGLGLPLLPLPPRHPTCRPTR